MANELLVAHNTGVNVYAVARIPNGANMGQWGSVTPPAALQAFQALNWANYAIVMVELGTTGFYEADLPDLFLTERAVEIIFYEQVGANPAMGDTRIAGALYEQMDQWFSTMALRV